MSHSRRHSAADTVACHLCEHALEHVAAAPRRRMRAAACAPCSMLMSRTKATAAL